MLEGQIAVVTGGAQGIGFAVASLLSERGVRVASWDVDSGNGEAMAGLHGLHRLHLKAWGWPPHS
mgnify:CR=1 FL=1